MKKDALHNLLALRAVFESLEDAIIIHDLNHTILNCNPAAEKLFGLNTVDLNGQSMYAFIPPGLHAEQAEILKKLLKAEKLLHVNTIRLSSIQKLLPVSVTVCPIKNEAGDVIGASQIIRENAVERKVEEKLHMLAAIIDGSEDAIISKTLHGYITSWNNGAEKVFGYREKEVIGKHISIIIPPDRMTEEAEIIANIRAGIKIDHFQTVRCRKGGMPVDISLTVSPIKDHMGNIIGASKIARDITAQNQAQATIKDLSKKKDEFIAMASHELKTPLTSMSGYLQLLSKKINGAEKPFVNNINRQLEKLTALVNDLFDTSRIQSGKLRCFFEEFNISELIEEIIEPLKETNPAYRIYKDLRKNVIVEGDKMRLEQAITNLLTNAIKYSPNADSINIHLEIQDQELYFSVKDYGLGIEHEHLRNIFNQFYSVRRQDKNISGLGLGLYITKEIIEQHRGRIWVESEMGKGSVFIFAIPIKQS